MRKKEGLAASLTKVGKIWFVFFSRWLAPEACLRHSREKKGKSSKLLLCTKAQDYSSFCPSHPIKDAPRENDEEGHTIAKKEGERQLGSKAKNQEESRECFQYSIVLQKKLFSMVLFLLFFSVKIVHSRTKTKCLQILLKRNSVIFASPLGTFQSTIEFRRLWY